MRRRTSTFAIAGALLLTGVFFSGAVGCSGGAPRATGTKTDWLVACDTEADCESDPDLICRCGTCTAVCSTDAECEQGVCGSEIATRATCGNDDGSTAAGERLCLPETDACLVAVIAQESDLGAAEPVSCQVEGALLCEDFEGLLPEVYSTWGDGESTAGLAECGAAQGSGALRIDAIDGGFTQTRMRLGTPVSGGEVHARFYLRVEVDSVLPAQLIVFELWDQEEGDVTERTTVYLNQQQALEVYVGASNQTLQAETEEPLAVGAWHCVELGMSLDDATGTVSLSLGETRLLSVANIDTLPSDPISVAVLEGVPAEGSQDTHATFYLDDLIVGTAPIGCD